ncbi:MAG: redox-regulated ATPase YchF [Clostridiales bacterium]|nr:redox-regulated ATPase YchF [Clostridiales bacterium]
MKLGIVGLPNVGKSTLFNAITKAGAQTANYPFCTIEPNIGTVGVPDVRLDKLSSMYNPKKTTPAVIDFVDIAGLVRGASKGEGLGNKFLSHIREVDAIVQVVRCFEDGDITHVDGTVDPVNDMEVINLELIFADIESVEKRIAGMEKKVKSGDKELLPQYELLLRIKAWLESNKPVRTMELDENEKKLVRMFFLLTSKPMMLVANMSEDNAAGTNESPLFNKLLKAAEAESLEVVTVSAKIEEEIAQLSDDEKQMFLEELGLEASGLDRLIRAAYKTLGLISYFTVGEDEVRAWIITNGMKAPQAAGKIHTDFERGFIRAEIIAYEDLISCGNMVSAKEKGMIRSEGKEYVMKDGDVTLFRFNV